MWPRAGLPGQHRVRERHADRVAQQAQRAARVAEHVGGVHDRRRGAGPVPHPGEDVELLREPCVIGGRFGHDPDVRLEHFARREQMLSESLARTPAGRLVTAEDIAKVVAFLCTPDAYMILG